MTPCRTLHRSFPYFVFAIISLSFALAFATDYPLTLSDDLGREVVLEAEPTRIVTMLPGQTETICALDACDKIVGVDTFSNYPAQIGDLPRLGGLFEPDIEGIIALEPDLVFVSESSELVSTLEGAGLIVYAGSPQRFDEVFEVFATLGEMVNREAEAAALSEQLRADIAAVEAQVAGRTPPSVFYELDATPYSVGPDSFIGVLIGRAGGDNIVAEGQGDFPQLDPEFIVAADPEVIILADAVYGETTRLVAARPGWDSIRAVQTGNVVELTQEQVDILNRPGPRLAEAIRIFAEIFHPDAFQDVP